MAAVAAHRNLRKVFNGPGTTNREIDIVAANFPQSVNGVALHEVNDTAVLVRRHDSVCAGWKLTGKANSPEPQRIEVTIFVLGAQNYLGAAATDVNEESLFVLKVKAAGHPQIDQSCFFLS